MSVVFGGLAMDNDQFPFCPDTLVTQVSKYNAQTTSMCVTASPDNLQSPEQPRTLTHDRLHD